MLQIHRFLYQTSYHKEFYKSDKSKKSIVTFALGAFVENIRERLPIKT